MDLDGEDDFYEWVDLIDASHIIHSPFTLFCILPLLDLYTFLSLSVGSIQYKRKKCTIVLWDLTILPKIWPRLAIFGIYDHSKSHNYNSVHKQNMAGIQDNYNCKLYLYCLDRKMCWLFLLRWWWMMMIWNLKGLLICIFLVFVLKCASQFSLLFLLISYTLLSFIWSNTAFFGNPCITYDRISATPFNKLDTTESHLCEKFKTSYLFLHYLYDCITLSCNMTCKKCQDNVGKVNAAIISKYKITVFCSIKQRVFSTSLLLLLPGEPKFSLT